MGKKFLMIILLILMIVFAGIELTKFQKKDEVETFVEAEEPIEWLGNYIWNDSNDNNSWMCFRKTVDLKEKDLKNIKAQIAVDSKYYLYINGELVVRDGAVKRGEKADSIYYDNIDLTKYFHKGKNTIAILAWYWGGESYSHISSGQAGMMFQMKVRKKIYHNRRYLESKKK